jgi:hypothetical protein
MNTKITALALAAATAFSFAPTPAKAGDKELALVGGLIGGLIIGSAISDHAPTYTRSTTVVVDGGRRDRFDDCDDHGYWKTVTVKVWVPGGWVVERGYRGGECRRYVSGYYTYRTDRVWVARDNHDRYDRHDRRDYGRGR